MPVYTLERGLVLQIGDALWEVQRLPDRSSVQLEHQTTGRIRRERLSKLTHDISSGAVAIVRSNGGEIAAPLPNSEGHFFCADSLRDVHKAAYLRAHDYVRAMRKRGIGKGQRRRIADAIAAVATDHGDKNPPKPSTVMRWMRLYESSGANAGSLVPRNAHRRRQRQLSEDVKAIVWANLRRRYFIRKQWISTVANDVDARETSG